MATYTRRILTLKDGREVEHLKTVRGTRMPGDETTYLVTTTTITNDDPRWWIAKSEVVRSRREKVTVKS